MTRVAIVVEGQTERDFVNLVLAPNMWEREVYPFPFIIGRAGGNVSVERLASDMADYYWNHDYVTSLVDFYGFRGKGSLTVQELEERIEVRVNGRVQGSQAQSRVFAYVQQHEFEGLLFSDANAFGHTLIVSDECVEQLRAIRLSFSTPEDINDSPITAPSKRISNLIPRYRKVVNGPLLAEEIGLSTIRRECPRFNAWVERMESLSDTQR